MIRLKKLYVLMLSLIVLHSALKGNNNAFNDKNIGFLDLPEQETVSATLTCNTTYVSGTTMILEFYLFIDFPYGDFFSITFPEGIIPTGNASDPIDFPTEGQDPEYLNGVSGRTISWGDNDNYFGGIEVDDHTFFVEVTIDENLKGNLYAQFQLSGDYPPDILDLYGEVKIKAPTPENLSTNIIGYASAEITWEDAVASTWNVKYGLAESDPDDYQIDYQPSKPYIIADLENYRQYKFYIRDSFDLGVVSDWAGPLSFTTLDYFTDTKISTPAISQIISKWGDLDNDGDLDLVVSGFTGIAESPYTRIFQNDNETNFTEINGVLLELKESSIDLNDYDKDGDLDILMTGADASENKMTIIYRNTGDLTFSIVSTDLPGISKGIAVWGDYDNDSDLDILLTGEDQESNPFSKIYRNDGNDIFTDASFKLKQLKLSSAIWGDLDNDNYNDLVLSGKDINLQTHTYIYKNTGGADLSIVSQNLAGISSGMIRLNDLDCDGYLDILLSGIEGTYIYINNDNFVFSGNGQNFPTNYSYGALDCGDINNDGTVDLITIEQDNFTWDYIKVYLNTGTGSFNPLNVKFPTFNDRINNPLCSLGDFDNDDDLDIVITGSNQNGTKFISVFNNNFNIVNNTASSPFGLNSKVEGYDVILSWEKCSDSETPAEGLTYNVRVGDEPDKYNIVSPLTISNNEPERTVVYMGNTHDTTMLIKNLQVGSYHWSVQTLDNGYKSSAFSDEKDFDILKPFTKLNTNLSDFYQPHSRWFDYDNDGDLDILIINDSESFIYRNDNVLFTEVDVGLPKAASGRTSVGDFNNDGLLDLVMIGTDYSGFNPSGVYKNNGNDNFSLINGIQLNTYWGDVAWGDYDVDGDLDLLCTGYNSNAELKTQIFRNDGADLFTEINDTLVGLWEGYVGWSDIDNDFDLDILISGKTGTLYPYETPVTRLYRNIGNDTFQEISSGLLELKNSAFDWGDYDNDGDLDLLIIGTSGNDYFWTKIYNNDGEGNFTDTESEIRFLKSGSSKFGDYDSDGYLDIILSGFAETFIIKIYHNNKDGSFTELDSGIDISISCKSEWGDIDNDTDLDFLLYGNNITEIYQNNINHINNQPQSPSNLKSERFKYGIKLSWDEPPDNQSEDGGFYYCIRMGSSPGQYDIYSAPVDTVFGFKRTLPSFQYTIQNLFWESDSLAEGTYYWTVQAVDQGFMSSNWAPEQSFSISVLRADFTFDTICVSLTTNFNDLSLSSGQPITDWLWDFGDGTFSDEKNPQHIFPDAGTFNVKLIVKSESYSDSITKNVIVKPRPYTSFTSNILCQGIPTTLTNTSDLNGTTITSWSWDFGDASTSTDEQPAPHGYLNAGDYSVKLKAVATNGCADSVTNIVSVGAYPVAAVTANAPLTFCKGESVTLSVPYFIDYQYTWKIDDTNLTEGDSSKYIAKLTGDYSVEIINPKGNCLSTSSDVSVTSNEAPTAPLISADGDLEFCQSDSVILSVTNNNEYSYQWKLNGGAVGIDSSRYIAKSSGTYSLTVSNSTGCSVDATNTIDVIVNPAPTLPTVNISGPTTFCEGDNVELSVINNPDYTYQWENNSAAITGETTNSYTAQNSGVYTLKITNSSGCFIRTEDVTVNVLDAPSAPLISTDGDLEFCQGDSVVLSVTPTAGYTYQWKLNGGAVDTDSSQYCAKSSGTYSLTVSNSTGCSVDATNTVSVTVNPVPTLPTVNISGPTTFCEGDTVGLSVTDNPAYTYQWENNGSLITGDTSNSYKALTTGTYKLNISNSYGCVTITSPVTVTVKPMPYVPVITSDNYNPGECMGVTPIRLYVDQEVPGYSYQWYRNGIPVAGETLSYIEDFLTEGDYSLEADLDGCTAESDIMNVYYEDAPDKPFIHAQGPTVWYLVCSDTTGSNYRWYCNGNLIERANKYYYIAGRKMGDYQVSISNSLGCFTRSEIVTIPTGDTGMDDVDPFEGLKIYPNPTNGLFIAEIENGIMGNLFIKIISQGGKELFNFMFEKTSVHFSTKLNISRQTKGYYLIIFDLNKQVAVRRIIID
jgi:PKD repeat protein